MIQMLDRAHPDAKLDLDFSNPLELLIALILAAQARDDLVNKITPTLFVKYRTAKEYAAAPLEELGERVRRINFSRVKSRRIKDCCAEIVRRFHGEVPRNLDDLLTLPGVGRKTANIVLFSAFGKNEGIAVDTHVFRVSRRLGITNKNTPEKVEKDLMEIVEKKEWGPFTDYLIWHGRKVCDARKPKCNACPLLKYCPQIGVTTSA